MMKLKDAIAAFLKLSNQFLNQRPVVYSRPEFDLERKRRSMSFQELFIGLKQLL